MTPAAVAVVCRLGLACALVGLLPPVARGSSDPPAALAQLDAQNWLARVHAAAATRNYRGTLVYSSGGVSSSSRVAHFWIGDQEFERVEAQDGTQRKALRQNGLVHTIWPQSGLAVIEHRSALHLLPSPASAAGHGALERYELRAEGHDRVAGRQAVVYLLRPRDEWRFARRIWADDETGLMLRADVIGPTQAVLESSAFSEIEIDVREQPDAVPQSSGEAHRQRVLRPLPVPTRLEAQGWVVARPTAGFHLAGCVTRALDAREPVVAAAAPSEVTHAVFSDGLTHVSLFIEAFDPARHSANVVARSGATYLVSEQRGGFRLTVTGAVPPATLSQLLGALERRP